uniref:Potassium channel domain-containing protein n=1 Tax=Parascaris univalens TaxID=6257 RepID=A0A915A4Y1_PARUN
MDEQFKEIEGLLEDAQPVEPRSFKKYAKLILPHVALVAVVCLYAVVGAWIFYSLESPHEDRLKRNGVLRINDLRKELVSSMWEKGRRGMMGVSMEQWMTNTDRRLQKFNENLYKAFKEEYVRYPDVRIPKSSTESYESSEEIRRLKRHRKSKARSEKGEKLWTASSALFFAATTMATIGYGNIVPVTPYGRIACVVFALFGAPLAIITIGDLGKFLSECTIWLYKKMKKARNILSYRFRKWRLWRSGVVTEVEEDMPSESEQSTLDWDDLVMDKTEVPVLLVFAILLLYIAFGGVLFAVLESWTYMDAFYYCFVSLTTIGFGDLVPERHEYIILMLIYLGVGLAVTTMCIDLVGIQYIQKIHYFGRKFRGTDLLHLLKRKRMIERRLAMGQGDEILQLYLQQLQDERSGPPIHIAQPHWNHKEEQIVVPFDANDNDLAWQADETIVDSAYPFDLCQAEKLPTPTVLSAMSVQRTRTPSLYSNSTASARSIMYYRRQFKTSSWTESGPSVEASVHCSLSTEQSVYERRAMYDNYRSPVPSLTSFEFEFPIPSPDLHVIAECARHSRRLRSCPSNIDVPSRSPLVSLTSSVRKWWKRRNSLRNAECRAAEAAVSARPADVCTMNANCFHISEPFMLSKLAAQCDLLERMPSTSLLCFDMPPVAEARVECALADESAACFLPSANVVTYCAPSVFQHIPSLNLLPLSKGSCACSLNPKFQYTRPKATTAVESNVSPNSRTLFAITEQFRNGPTAKSVRRPSAHPILRRKKKERRDRRQDPLSTIEWLNVSPRAQLMETIKNDLPTLFERVRNKHQSHASRNSSSVVLVSPRNPVGLACMEEWDSYIKMLDEYCKPYVSVNTPSKPPSPAVLSPPELPGVIAMIPKPEPEIEAEEAFVEEEDAVSPMCVESSSESGSPAPPMYDIDLGAFELVDSGVSAEALLSHVEPVLYHQELPVHSVHHDTVQTEAALENLMSAPESMLSSIVPPTMVEDNYCFVVDGDKIRMGDIMGDDQWWRHTSRPTKYFYSEDMRKFIKVNCITAKGKVISARLTASSSSPMSPMHTSTASSTPRSSMSGASSRNSSGYGEKVPLSHVYKVVRFYSFWRTCTSFHRIVTMIDKVNSDDKHGNPSFKKRLFVQYLWRNAKPADKMRVQKEFDPR